MYPSPSFSCHMVLIVHYSNQATDIGTIQLPGLQALLRVSGELF